jgi:choline dehydrogenase-like flavoprotein
VATLSGNRFSVESRYFIMACGAVGNARMLLASNRRASEGIGNARDLVGRYFMDHPRVRPAGVLLWTDPRAAKIQQYASVDGVRATLSVGLTPELQERERLANNMLFVEGRESQANATKRREDLETARFLRLGDPAPDATLSKWWIRSEQSPNPSSRVTLSSERDALGVRRPVLNWLLQDLDRHTLGQASRSYAQILTRAGLARVRVAPELLEADDSLFARVTGDWHQMGTTRMADSPERGVVDAACRVFGLDNLFVAGASVFPTSGAMNPTLTLVALSLRLADHIGALALE